MISILHLDPSLVICIKPAGILSQPSPHSEESMLSLLAARCGGEIFPVHRLDRETGGVMVFARTQRAAACLSQAMARREVRKIYCCVVSGHPLPERGVLKDLLYTDRARNKSFVVQRMRKGVKEAALSYEVLAAGEAHSLLRIELHTGRTHQIRVQFSSRRLPLVGDAKYGGERGELALWCAALRFCHPASGGMTTFFAPPPAAGIWEEFPGQIDETRLCAPLSIQS